MLTAKGLWNRLRRRQAPIVRLWNDLEPYKKVFLGQGFHELAREGLARLELAPYDVFEARGAPPVEGAPYHSHKNINLLEVTVAGRTVRVAYDTNDLYYKIPNDILRWSDLYFKSNYQPDYLRSGKLLDDAFWRSQTFRPECLPEPLDLSQSAKFRPCSFTMELFDDFALNRRYLRRWTGAWLRTPVESKPHTLFYFGRWWAGSEQRGDAALLRALGCLDAALCVGVAEAGGTVPPDLRRFVRKAVTKDEWLAMCCASRAAFTARGLDGCASFKALNFLMVGSPFVAQEIKAPFWRPLAPDVNYVLVKDDLSDLREQIERYPPGALRAMGERNLAHWRNFISPAATARHVLQECERIL